MQVFCLLFLLFCVGVKAFEDNVIQIPLQRNFVSKEVLMERQNARLFKLGIKKGSLPKYHQKLIENPNILDYFTTNISLGSPAQNFNVMLSSDSARLWVLDKEYPSKSKNQNAYNPTSSSTSKNLNKDFSQTDGPFKSYGKFYSDNFQMGRIKVQGQAFGSVQKIEDSNDFLYPIDGVLGFDHLIPSVYKNGSEPTAPGDNILKNVKRAVTVYMKSLFNHSKTDLYGQFTIGGFDNAHCNANSLSRTIYLGEFTFLNRFATNVTDFYFGNHMYLPGFLYFDSSYSNLVLPTEELNLVYNSIQPDYNWDLGLYTIPCSRVKDISEYIIIWATNDYFYIYKEAFIVDFDLENDVCVVSVEMNDGTYPREFIVGVVLARQYCVHHDYESNKVLLYNHF